MIGRIARLAAALVALCPLGAEAIEYYRPAQAFGAVSAPIAQGAAPEATNARSFQARVVDKLGFAPGTSQYGTLRTLLSVASAVPASGGSVNAVNDTLTQTSGTCTTFPTYTVTAVSGGAVTTVAVANKGACSVIPTTAGGITVTSSNGLATVPTLTATVTNERHLAIPDAVYSAITAGGVNVGDALYNSATAAGAYGNTSEVPTENNPGLHRQVILCVGDSITNSQIGAGTYTEFAQAQNRLWYQGVDAAIPAYALAPVAAPTAASPPAPQPPEVAQTYRWAHERSRLKYNFGRDSGRLANQSGMTYTQGLNWIDNFGQMKGLRVASGQQLVVQIFAGTNDIKYADDNSNPGLAAVPTGTAGASSAGSPNYVSNALVPFLNLVKAEWPSAKILFVVPLARSTAAGINVKFVDVANYVIANKQTLGIDLVLDTRQIPTLSATTPSVTSNTTYYQGDGVHLTPAGVRVTTPYFVGAYDKLLGYTPDSSVAGALQ